MLSRPHFASWFSHAGVGAVSGYAVLKNDLILNRQNYLALPPDRIPDAGTLPDDLFPKQRQRQFRIIASSGMYGGTAKNRLLELWSSGESIPWSSFDSPFAVGVPKVPPSFKLEARRVEDDERWFELALVRGEF